VGGARWGSGLTPQSSTPELAAGNPEFADWYDNFQAMIEAFETDVSLLTDDQRMALSVIARQRREVVFALWDLAGRVHQLAYEEGFHHGLAAADEPCDDDDERS
jgi:hypothetical protein